MGFTDKHLAVLLVQGFCTFRLNVHPVAHIRQLQRLAAAVDAAAGTSHDFDKMEGFSAADGFHQFSGIAQTVGHSSTDFQISDLNLGNLDAFQTADFFVLNVVGRSSCEQIDQNTEGETQATKEEKDALLDQQNTNVLTDQDAALPQTQPITSANDSVVTTTVVTVKVKGSMGQFSALVGRAAAKKGVAVRSFALTNQEKDETASALAEVLNETKKSKEYPYTAELVFEVYQSSQV